MYGPAELPAAARRPERSLWREPRPTEPRQAAPRPRLDLPVWAWRIIVAVQARLGRI